MEKLYRFYLKLRLQMAERRLKRVRYFLPKSRGYESRDLYDEQADLLGEIGYVKKKLGLE